MLKKMSLALLAGASFLAGINQAAAIEAGLPAEPAVIYAEQPAPPPVRTAYAERSSMGGGFIEFLFGEGPSQGGRNLQQPGYQPSYEPRRPLLPPMGAEQAMRRQEDVSEPARPAFDPKYEKQLVEYHGKESPGTIVVDTPNKFLFLVQGDGKALRYGIGVGRPGFTWSGVKQISAKKEWPAWTPPPEMLVRRPTCRGTWKAARKIRSAPARCIWDRRSTVSTVRTSPGPSAPTFRPAASGCAMRT